MFHLQCRELNELNLAILFNANVELYAIDLRVFIRAIDSKRAREEVEKKQKGKKYNGILLCGCYLLSSHWKGDAGDTQTTSFFPTSSGVRIQMRWYIEYAIEFNDQDLSLYQWTIFFSSQLCYNFVYHGIKRLDTNV